MYTIDFGQNSRSPVDDTAGTPYTRCQKAIWYANLYLKHSQPRLLDMTLGRLWHRGSRGGGIMVR